MLSPADERELLELLEAQYGGEGLEAFIRRVVPRLPPPAHMAPLRRAVERSRHEEIRVCVSVPRRHGKTMTLAPGLAWLINRDPACVNALCGYGADFVSEWSRKIRRWAQAGGITLRDDAQAVGRWRTEQDGGLIASGIGGPLTGFGVTGLLVIDDPIKNPLEAESQLMRDRTWEWFIQVASPTVEPGGSIIVCATRWHQDDLIGRLKQGQDGQKWEIIEMPAVMDAQGNAADERMQSDVHALWPEQYPLERLATYRMRGEHPWWSQYQQQPRPRGGQLFIDPQRFDMATLDHRGMRYCVGVDPAATEGTTGDYSAVVTLGVDWQGICYVLDVQRWHVAIPDLVRRLLNMGQVCKYATEAPIMVEAVGGFKSVAQYLRELGPGLNVNEVKLPAGKDKFLRAQPLSGAWNAGRVKVPISAPWLDPFMQEMMAFTGTKADVHDDQVDALVHAFDFLAGRAFVVSDWGNGTSAPRAFTSTRKDDWDDD